MDRYKSLEQFQLEQINRLHILLKEQKSANVALQEALRARQSEVQDWQELAVDLGAFAEVKKDTARSLFECKLMVDVGMLAVTKDRIQCIEGLVLSRIAYPIIHECDRVWGKQK